MKINDLKNVPVFIVFFLIVWIFFEAIKLTQAFSSIPMPEPPRLLPDGSTIVQEAKGKEIENYKNLINAMHSRRLVIYENVVSKTLMPIFTSLIVAVLGYIFAEKALKAIFSYREEKIKQGDNP